MISMTIQALAELLATTTDAAVDVGFEGVTIDSRKPCHGQLFVAIKGEHFDGHGFVDKAFQNGAVAALVEQKLDSDITQIVVADCKQAMMRLANYWRRQCNPCVIALTGSNGKTTVKEMLLQILSRQAPTHATRGNFNNDIGVPLTLFDLAPQQKYAIIEMGANHIGEIAELARIANPDIVYVNNVAAAHLTGFGNVQGVIQAKGELYAYCKPGHHALFNADEVASQYWRDLCVADLQLTCGLNKEADVTASWQSQDDGLQVEFKYRGQSHFCKLFVFGEHNVRNALAAVSLAILAGIEFQQAVANLSGFSGVSGRLQMIRGPSNSRLIDDSYNANPDSLEAGIKVLCSLQGSAWLALGDMAELGSETEALHRKAARTARQYGIEKFFGIGEMSCIASEEFGESGYCFERIEEMAEMILSQIHQGVNLLVKGSRAAGMEKLVEALTQSLNGKDANAL